MKFSLRSLMIVVTLLCAGLGGRIEYLRRWAAFHSEREDFWSAKLRQLSLAEARLESGYQPSTPEIEESAWQFSHHRKKKEEYQGAILRPWTVVEESTP